MSSEFLLARLHNQLVSGERPTILFKPRVCGWVAGGWVKGCISSPKWSFSLFSSICPGEWQVVVPSVLQLGYSRLLNPCARVIHDRCYVTNIVETLLSHPPLKKHILHYISRRMD